jgi:hypothetical protein
MKRDLIFVISDIFSKHGYNVSFVDIDMPDDITAPIVDLAVLLKVRATKV